MPKQRKLFVLASQLKAGKGLVMAVAVMPGEFDKNVEASIVANENLENLMEEEKVKGFTHILVSAVGVPEGISAV